VNGLDRPATQHEFGVLKISSVTSGVFDPAENKAIRADEIDRAKSNPRADRIIISRCNTADLLGASAYIEQDHQSLFLPDKLWQLQPTSEGQICMRWLANWLAASSTRAEISALATGSSGSMKNIAKEAFLNLAISVPPVHEQRRIASVLAVWDQTLAKTESLLHNSRAQWNALLGVTLHLPSANPEARVATHNGGFPASVQPGIPALPPAPVGWRRTQLRDHLKEVRRPVKLESGRPYALVTVKRSRGGVALREVLTGKEVKTPSQFHIREGDFLISKRQIVHGACGIVPPVLDGAIVSNEYAVLNSDGQIDLRFLRYLSESRYFQQTCFHSSIGVHVEKMIFKTERWLRWPFNIPPLPVQQRIVEVLDTARREMDVIAAQVERLKREKAALMADLLTGRRRVRDTSTEIAS
jgi:type I restriction enzyme S subunit